MAVFGWKLLPYTPPSRVYAYLRPAFMVFQGGVAQLPTKSVTGGGNVPGRNIPSVRRPVVMQRSLSQSGIQGMIATARTQLSPLITSPEIDTSEN